MSAGPSTAAAAASEALAMGHMPDKATLLEAKFEEDAVGRGETMKN